MIELPLVTIDRAIRRSEPAATDKLAPVKANIGASRHRDSRGSAFSKRDVGDVNRSGHIRDSQSAGHQHSAAGTSNIKRLVDRKVLVVVARLDGDIVTRRSGVDGFLDELSWRDNKRCGVRPIKESQCHGNNCGAFFDHGE